MKFNIYEINAFTSKDFEGNPAAVCLLDDFLTEDMMLAIAAQNNLSETAFIVHDNNNRYAIRWFAPKCEVGLVGHATLAASYVIFNEIDPELHNIEFTSASGTLNATRKNNTITLNFPASISETLDKIPSPIAKAINVKPQAVLGSMDYIVVLKNEREVAELNVDMNQLLSLDRRGVVFTAPGDNADFVSRVFHPKLGIGEDPVCGSAHCQLTPYWSNILKKDKLHALQLSSRKGELFCEIKNDRILLTGECNLYLKGKIFLNR